MGSQYLVVGKHAWDATRVLNGFPGEFVTIARRYWNRLKFGSFGSGAPGTSSFGIFSSLRRLTGYRQKPQNAHNTMKPQCQRLRAKPAHRYEPTSHRYC